MTGDNEKPMSEPVSDKVMISLSETGSDRVINAIRKTICPIYKALDFIFLNA